MKPKHLRMQGWDFTSPGWYFLTLSTKEMRSEFGTVVNGRMNLNESGRIAERFWREIPAHFPRAVVDEHVVMPNHVHGLLQLTTADWSIEGRSERLEAFGKPVAGSISTIVRSYKSAVSRALAEACGIDASTKFAPTTMPPVRISGVTSATTRSTSMP